VPSGEQPKTKAAYLPIQTLMIFIPLSASARSGFSRTGTSPHLISPAIVAMFLMADALLSMSERPL
jgi:hypothetical protein